MLDQQQQEQEQQQVGQEVVPPGISTTLDEAEQVEPKCLLKRSMVVVSALWGNTMRLCHVRGPANGMLV